MLETLRVSGSALARALLSRLSVTPPLRMTRSASGRAVSLSLDTSGMLLQARVTQVHRAAGTASDPIYPADVRYTVVTVAEIGGARVTLDQVRPLFSPFEGETASDGAGIIAAPVGSLAYMARVITGQGPLGIQYVLLQVHGERRVFGECQ
jgi:hypothetical protein